MNLIHLVVLVSAFVFSAYSSAIPQNQGRAENDHASEPEEDSVEPPYDVISALEESDLITTVQQSGIEPSAVNLYYAARNGDLDEVNRLLAEGASPLWQNPALQNWWTAAHVAAYHNEDRVLKALLQNGVSPNVYNKNGYTPLYLAARQGSVEAIKELIAASADLNLPSKSTSRNTPLIKAAQKGHLDAVSLLINRSANVNKVNSYGSTALMWAARNGHLLIVKELFAANADIHVKNKKGSTAFNWAADYHNGEIASYLAGKGAKSE